MDISAVDSWPFWLIALSFLLNVFKSELAVFVPKTMREYFAARADLRRERQEHRQDIEEASAEAILSAAVAAQAQLIQLNERLTNFVVDEVNSRLSEIERKLNGLEGDHK